MAQWVKVKVLAAKNSVLFLEFYLWNQHGRRRELTSLSSFVTTSMYVKAAPHHNINK